MSDYLLDQVKPGDRFTANGPAGVFRYQPVFHSKKSLFLAGGSGITPLLSMTREILDAGLDRDVVMLYGCRNPEAALYHEELTAYSAAFPNFRYHLVVSDPVENWDGERGFLDEALIRRLVPDFAQRTSYICGPQVMNDFCKSALEAMGVPEKKIRREMFGARRDIQNEPGWPAELTGNEVFTITVGDKKIPAKSGNVFLARGMMRRYADEKYGYIHSCKAYPMGDIEIML